MEPADEERMLSRQFRYLGLALAAVVTEAQAHHSYAEYDDTRIVEIEGSLVRTASQNPHVRERFTPAADGSGLDYTLDVTDSDSLTEPAQFRRSWVWRPGEQVLPFECKE